MSYLNNSETIEYNYFIWLFKKLTHFVLYFPILFNIPFQ